MLRFIRREDLPRLVEIDQVCHPHPCTLTQFEDLLRSGVWGVLIDLDGEILGYTLASVNVDYMDVLNIAVSPKARRSGLGILLLLALLTQAKSCGCYKVMLEVRISNANAFSLYRWAGFELVGRRYRYYYNVTPSGPRNYEDALVMKCLLGEDLDL
ncbi:ribosomal protein S18-alanine N-acetyltransferase [Candidatus Ichthyocystis hellenicum]|uniref:ribosomal protein S18-alanine N-acetyltransferase n=1 Tax=Candidatus Ichthyocystis hellenicum TaxID=1561003 RepID=UPI000B82DB69|nr:ribosomal protein S18-alanine N-acetyltransferase [Candidatus Ichthyocystis hellenicum]